MGRRLGDSPRIVVWPTQALPSARAENSRLHHSLETTQYRGHATVWSFLSAIFRAYTHAIVFWVMQERLEYACYGFVVSGRASLLEASQKRTSASALQSHQPMIILFAPSVARGFYGSYLHPRDDKFSVLARARTAASSGFHTPYQQGGADTIMTPHVKQGGPRLASSVSPSWRCH